MKIKFDINSFGITQKSLDNLKNELLTRARDKIAIIGVPTSHLCFGYLIIDKDKDEAIWTGDGFRIDRNGEGGAGYKTAETLFHILGLSDSSIYWVDMIDENELINNPKETLKKVIDNLLKYAELRFHILVLLKSSYIR